jgi:hypothetical protein
VLEWHEEAVNVAALIGPLLDKHGCACMVAHDHTWGQIKSNITPEIPHSPAVTEVRDGNGDVTTVGRAEILHRPSSIRPRPAHLEPPELAANDDDAIRAVHKFKCPKCLLSIECEADLTKILMASLNEERASELRSHGHAALGVSPREIVEAMMSVHAVFDLGDVVLLRAPLFTPLGKVANFVEQSSRHKLKLIQLADPVVDGACGKSDNHIHFRDALAPHNATFAACFAIHDGSHPECTC